MLATKSAAKRVQKYKILEKPTINYEGALGPNCFYFMKGSAEFLSYTPKKANFSKSYYSNISREKIGQILKVEQAQIVKV